jgi:hypothetical protein
MHACIMLLVLTVMHAVCRCCCLYPGHLGSDEQCIPLWWLRMWLWLWRTYLWSRVLRLLLWVLCAGWCCVCMWPKVRATDHRPLTRPRRPRVSGHSCCGQSLSAGADACLQSWEQTLPDVLHDHALAAPLTYNHLLPAPVQRHTYPALAIRAHSPSMFVSD